PQPSSRAPSQSLSSRSPQISGWGWPATASQIAPPIASQTILPEASHSPMPTLQGAPRLKPSSTLPSQLLSSPSQISGCEPGPTMGAQASGPPVQASAPGAERAGTAGAAGG